MANASALDFNCDWRFGINISSSLKASVGYLLDWSGCGGLNLKKDIEVWNPCDKAARTVVTDSTVKCIGLIESFKFEGGENDPIRIVAYLSKGMAAEVRAKLANPLRNTQLKLGWYIIDYDEELKRWYEAAYCKSPTKADANIDSSDGELQIFVANEATRVNETLDINVFKFEFQVVPADGKTTQLEFATGPQRRLVKKWSGG